MNRKLWVAVGATITVMGAVDYGARPTGAIRDFVQKGIELWDRLGALISWDIAGFSTVAALLVLLVSMRKRRGDRHPEPWRKVIELGRKGRSVSQISYVTRQPQDAVRILLAPVALDRDRPRGKSFRASGPEKAETPASRPRRPRQ